MSQCLVNQVCWILVWLNINNSVLQSWSPSPSKTQTFTPSKPQNFVFLGRTALFLVQDPLGDPLPSLPASLYLSLSLCLYLGAVRAPLLKLLLKREHIQWGLSQPHSVSIKDPGNTALSREPLLKGQWDSGYEDLNQSPSHLLHGKEKSGIFAANDCLWMVCDLCRALTQTVSASITLDITVSPKTS